MAPYPKTKIADPARPYRLWNAVEKKVVPHRYFGIKENAHNAAMIEARWAKKIGHSIEVFDARTAKLLGQYTLRVKGVEWLE